MRYFFRVLSLLFLLIAIPSLSAQSRGTFFTGRVLTVENRGQSDGDDLRGASFVQEAEVLLLDGPRAGESVEITRRFTPDRQFLSIPMQEGMEIIVRQGGRESDRFYDFQDVVRQRGLLYLLIGFAVLVVAVGRLQGVKTLLTLAITALFIFYVIIPLLLAGYPPIPVASISAVIILSCILIIIGGPNRKSVAAIIGTSIGVLIAGILAFLVGEFIHLTGFGEMNVASGFDAGQAQLLMSENITLDIRGVLFAGIIIGSLGAIADVGMSVASAAEQVRNTNPSIDVKSLRRSGMSVGRDIMGTMSNTLILAYFGSAINLLLVFSQLGVGWSRIINMDVVATEVVRGLAGTIGLVLAIPVTAAVAAYLFTATGRSGGRPTVAGTPSGRQSGSPYR